MKAFLFILLALLVSPAQAATVASDTYTSGDLSMCPNGRAYTVCPSAYKIVLTWAAPIARTDETAATGGEISHYLVSIDGGAETNIGNVLTYTFTGVATGAHTVTVRAVDSDGTSGTLSTWGVEF